MEEIDGHYVTFPSLQLQLFSSSAMDSLHLLSCITSRETLNACFSNREGDIACLKSRTSNGGGSIQVNENRSYQSSQCRADYTSSSSGSDPSPSSMDSDSQVQRLGY
ncbi:potassium-transporting ATPase C chain [Striga asiatica]|uniref:Potassium-transporting ATPase C chain n=1 Tax=Striga asiatica TaxID=4170 RepID=A0A5A7PGJ6_STRAF|nr:potassium-transporting ATPase C chain [Striga asiatica]